MTPTKKILIIDDDETACALFKMKIEKRGDCSVDTANSGGEGLKMARGLKPDLIVLDVMIPDIDGGEVKFELSQRPETKDIPILFLTSLTDEAHKSGDSWMLPKSSPPADIVNKIIELLEEEL